MKKSRYNNICPETFFIIKNKITRVPLWSLLCPWESYLLYCCSCPWVFLVSGLLHNKLQQNVYNIEILVTKLERRLIILDLQYNKNCLSGPASAYQDGCKKNFVCKCGRQYLRKDSLVKHLRYECSKEPQFSCPHCPYRAKHKCNLKAHIIYKHTQQLVKNSLDL